MTERPLDEVVSTVREVSSVRRRAAQGSARWDRLSGAAVGGGYAVTALALALASGGTGDLGLADVARTAALVALYVVAYRTEFASASGSAVPTQPVLVALLLTTPLTLVPLAVLVAQQLGAVGSPRSGSLASTLVVRSVSGWHCLGPVVVLAVADPGPPSLAHWPVYAAALAAQFVADALVAVTRSWCLGVAPRDLARPLAWTFAVDTLLGALGLAVVVAVHDTSAAGVTTDVVLLSAPILLVRLLAADRARSVAAAVTLEGALTEASSQARHDVLTGLANRRAWDEALAGTRDGATVLVADLDGLKAVNDVHGHAAGDDLIRAMAAVLRSTAPDGSLVARLGGDEFGVLLRSGDAAAGTALAVAVRAAAAAHPGVCGLPLSASLGWASCGRGGDMDETLAVADARAGADKAARRAGRRAGDLPAVPPARDGGQTPDAATSSTSRSSVRTETPVPPTGV